MVAGAPPGRQRRRHRGQGLCVHRRPRGIGPALGAHEDHVDQRQAQGRGVVHEVAQGAAVDPTLAVDEEAAAGDGGPEAEELRVDARRRLRPGVEDQPPRGDPSGEEDHPGHEEGELHPDREADRAQGRRLGIRARHPHPPLGAGAGAALVFFAAGAGRVGGGGGSTYHLPPIFRRVSAWATLPRPG